MPPKKQKWIWIGIAIAITIGLVLLYRYWDKILEGFENATGKMKSFVVYGSLSTITSVANQNKIGSIEKGAFDEKYAISTITDYKDAEIWKAGQTPSTDDTKRQYRLNFPNDITFSLVDTSNTPARTVDVFVPKLAAVIPTADLSFVGEDFTSNFIIVSSKITTLIDPYVRGSAANEYKGVLSGLGTGRASTNYAVSRILDDTGLVYYDKSAPMRQIYIVNFTADVDLKIISDLLTTDGDRTALPETDLKSLRLIGTASTDTRTTFTGVKARIVALEGALSALLAKDSLETMKKFGTGTADSQFAPSSIQTVDSKTVWTKDDPMKKFRVEFLKPVNLRIAAEQIPKKIRDVKYLGLAFSDTGVADLGVDEYGIRRRRGSVAQLGAADYSYSTMTSTVPDEFFPDKFLESGTSGSGSGTSGSGSGTSGTSGSGTSGSGSSNQTPGSSATTIYEDPRTTAVKSGLVAGGSDMSGYTSTMTPLTNRFRIRGKWSTISKSGMIATFGIAAGKLPDGTYPKVVEILNYKDQKIWPEGSAGSVPYVDTGLTELFTIGYDVMVDPKRSLESYIQTYMPSVVLANPAMPRPNTR